MNKKGHQAVSIRRSKGGIKEQNMSYSRQGSSDKFKKREERIKVLEQDIADFSKIADHIEEDSTSPVDRVWRCDKCNLRLGVYDPKEDILRIRYKDFYAYYRAGTGGFCRIICRSCSHINELQYIDK